MALLTDRCICLRRIQYSETSQIVNLFGRHLGVFRAIAKGAHRRTKAGASRFDGGVDLLDVGDALATNPADRDLATLAEWKLADGHIDLRQNQRGLYLALYCSELVGLLIHENDPHLAVFDLTVWLLEQLATSRLEESFVAYQLELLTHTGFVPQFGQCVGCGKKPPAGRVTFSYAGGGVICPQCAAPEGEKVSVDSRLLRMLDTMLHLPHQQGIPQRLPRLTRQQSDPANRLLAGYLRNMLGHKLRVAPYVLENS